MDAPFRDPRFDLPVLALCTLGTAALTAGMLAAAAHDEAVYGGYDAFGPTAGAMNFLVGAALAMLVGCALAACVSRGGSRLATGIIVGSLTWLVAVVPITGADHLTGLLCALLTITGSVTGAAIGLTRDFMRTRARRRGAI